MVGDTVYSRKGYIICKTTYDQNSPLLYDLVGDIRQFDEFIECAKLIKEQRNLKTVKFPVVLAYMKKEKEDFNYKAIRVWPHPNTFEKRPSGFPTLRWFCVSPTRYKYVSSIRLYLQSLIVLLGKRLLLQIRPYNKTNPDRFNHLSGFVYLRIFFLPF